MYGSNFYESDFTCLSLDINFEKLHDFVTILKRYSALIGSKNEKENREKPEEILSNHHVTDPPSRI